MGQLGVAVGLPGGEWREVAVGDDYPRDFSFAGKMNPLTETGFWVGALAAAFAVGGVAVAFYALNVEGAGRAALIGIWYISTLPISAALALIAIWLFGLYSIIIPVILAGLSAAFGLPLLAITRMKASPLRRGIALGCSALGAVLGAAALLPYNVRDPGYDNGALFTWVLGASAVVFSAVGLALAALAVRRMAAAASAIALSYALLIAAFALWIANAIPAAVLFLLAPIAVSGALRRFLRMDSRRRRGGIAADS